MFHLEPWLFTSACWNTFNRSQLSRVFDKFWVSQNLFGFPSLRGNTSVKCPSLFFWNLFHSGGIYSQHTSLYISKTKTEVLIFDNMMYDLDYNILTFKLRGWWCNNITTCYARKKTHLGSSKYMSKQIAFSGILGDNQARNPGIYYSCLSFKRNPFSIQKEISI